MRRRRDGPACSIRRAHSDSRIHFGIRGWSARITAVLLSILGGTVPALAQETNRGVFEQLARECLAELPADVDTLAVDAPDQMPYLRSALIDTWKSSGREIYRADHSAAQASTVPRLAFTISEAGVEYAAMGRRRLIRDVTLVLHYTLTGPDGRIIADEHCTKTASDSIRRADVALLEDPAFAETQGEAPRAGWVRRYVEPAVLAAATAVGVYLFFTLRSQSTDD